MADGPRLGFDFARIQILPTSSAPEPSTEERRSPSPLPPAPAAVAPAAVAPAAVAAPTERLAEPASSSCARLHWGRGQRITSYRVAGYVGYLAGLAVVVVAARITGATRAILPVATVVPLSFLLAVWLSRAAFGYERIVYFEKALFAIGATALVLAATGHDVGRGVDLATLGIGTFLAAGRIGCLMAGCCHGRPSRWGIRYGVEHARAGLAWYHVGRPLFPIQIVDGAVSLAVVAVALAAARAPHPPGAIAASYLLAYGAVRFFEEWFRGDAARPRWLGVSEAQWTALLIAAAVAAIARQRGPAQLEIAVASILGVAAIAAVSTRRLLARTAWGLTSPWHVEEIHRKLLQLERAGDGRMIETSQGLCLSLRRVEGAPLLRDHVLSFTDRPLPLPVAEALVGHVRFDRDPADRVEVKAGATPGLVHVLVWKQRAAASASPPRPGRGTARSA